MLRSHKISVALAIVVATFPQLSAPALNAASTFSRGATVKLVAVEPDLLLPVDHKTVLKVTVRYDIEHFEKSKFYLMPQYWASGNKTTSGAMRKKQRTYLETASGREVVDCDLGALENNTDVERPLRLSIFLLEESSENPGLPVAISETVVVLTK